MNILHEFFHLILITCEEPSVTAPTASIWTQKQSWVDHHHIVTGWQVKMWILAPSEARLLTLFHWVGFLQENVLNSWSSMKLGFSQQISKLAFPLSWSQAQSRWAKLLRPISAGCTDWNRVLRHRTQDGGKYGKKWLSDLRWLSCLSCWQTLYHLSCNLTVGYYF